MRGGIALISAVVVFCIGCDTVEVDEIDLSPPLEPIRTVYQTQRNERGYALSESLNGDVYVAAFGEGGIGVTDGLQARPYVLRIERDGTLAVASPIAGIEWGNTLGLKDTDNGLIALVNRQEFVSQFLLAGVAKTLYRLNDAFGIEATLMDETIDSPDRIIRTSGPNILIITRLRATGKRNRLNNYSTGGTKLWTYDMPEEASIVSARETQDGKYHVVGEVASNQYLLVELAPTGSEIKTVSIPIVTDGAYGLKLAVGSEYLIVAGNFKAPDESRHLFISKYTLDGFQLWERDFLSGVELSVTMLTELPDGDIVFAWSRLESIGYKTISEVVRLNENGEVLWKKPFEPQFDTAVAHGSMITSDNRLVILGRVGPDGYYERDHIVVWQIEL